MPNHLRKLFSISIFFLALTSITNAQIFPPDFLCVRADTLFWELPNNTCGSFNAYEIYVSDDINGPYNLLGTVTDENQTNFFHVGAGANVWYYYLVSDYDCPGEMQIFSDTLNNTPPGISVIESVTVENGQVRVNWYASPSPEVIGYIIYRETNVGVIPVDTVFGDLTFFDVGSDPDVQTETYFVNALDACGNTSIFDNPHTTIELDNTIQGCEQTITVNWSSYQNWQNPIDRYEIWVSINNGPFNLDGTVAGDVNSYDIPDLTDGEEYCFFVKAVESGTNAFSDSPISCEILEIVQPIRDLFVKNVSVTANNEVEVTWGWNSNAELSAVDLFQQQEGELPATFSIQPVPDPLGTESSFLDNMASPANGVVTYQLQTTDDCDSTFLSNTGSSIFLEVSPINGQFNQLTWTQLGIENTFSITYDVFKIVGGSETLITSIPAPDSTYADPISVENPEEANACYYIAATATLVLPDGSMETIRSTSNRACAQQEAQILTPNAFAPRGVNREFKPIISFGQAASYQMSIYDRYGQKLFESTDPEVGWRGQIDGEDAAQGTYVYYIKVVQANGNVVENGGVVVLLR